MTDGIEPVPDPEPLKFAFELLPATDQDPPVNFEWKFPTLQELQTRKCAIRENLRKHQIEWPSLFGGDGRPRGWAEFDLDEFVEAVFRINYGGIMGINTMTKQDLDLVSRGLKSAPYLPILDEVFLYNVQRAFSSYTIESVPTYERITRSQH